MKGAIDRAAKRLLGSCRAFTSKNLFHELRREDARFAMSPEAFERMMRRRPIPGLVGLRRAPRARPVPREWDAYFPAAILVGDRPAIVDLFAASGVLVQSRVAVVSLDGYPHHVTAWLARGLRAGHRAPVGYLHDRSTVAYPFAFEPLATFVEVGVPLYRDLGLPPDGDIAELEEIRPHALVQRSIRSLLGLCPRDAMLVPLKEGAR